MPACEHVSKVSLRLSKCIGINHCLVPGILNISLGKFGQRSSAKPFQIFVESDQQLTDIFNSSLYNVKDCRIVSEKFLQLTLTKKLEKLPPNRNTCVLINSYTTAYARQLLFKTIQSVLATGASVLYTDTDSLIFLKHKSMRLPFHRHSSIIGALKSEIPHDMRIQDFFAIASKVYSLNFTMKGSSVIKGMSITFSQYLAYIM